MVAVLSGLLVPLVPAGATTPTLKVYEVQGAHHSSPFDGQIVSITGVVTATRSNGFFVQDPTGDDNVATSDGIFVFTNSFPSVAAGDSVSVTGMVTEFMLGGPEAPGLSLTEITGSLSSGPVSTTVLSSGNPLPSEVVIGEAGRIPPDEVIDDDSTGGGWIDGAFDPADDGLDFYESLEGMRVAVNHAVAVGPSWVAGLGRQIVVVGDGGAFASTLGARSSLPIGENDFNPERIIVAGLLDNAVPIADAGTTFGEIHGILDYSSYNYRLFASQPLVAAGEPPVPEKSVAPAKNELVITSLNLRKLGPQDNRLTSIADLVVDKLAGPDLIALQEVQDNSGMANDGVVEADDVLSALVAAIEDVGGPTYHVRQIDPADNTDGGVHGANNRNVFLFRSDRGLTFNDVPGGSATAATTVIDEGDAAALSASPGRIDPSHAAWNTSRKPLVGQFEFGGERLFVINNHFVSRSTDDPLLGRFQPPRFPSVTKRSSQALVVKDFVKEILNVDPGAQVVVLGDLNEYEFGPSLQTLKDKALTNLTDGLALADRYTVRFEGNAMALDHILISEALNESVVSYDAVHTNSDYANSGLDHDPVMARLSFPEQRLTVNKDGTGSGTVASSPAGISCGETCEFGFPYASAVTLSPEADAGSVFSGWSGSDCSGTGQCVVTADEPRVVSATFTAVVSDSPSLKLRYVAKKKSFKAKLSTNSSCVGHRKGVVRKKVKGPDIRLGRFTTNDRGVGFVRTYKKKGTFYTKVAWTKRTINGTIYTCKAAVSPRLKRV